jgi:hypothetical protein
MTLFKALRAVVRSLDFILFGMRKLRFQYVRIGPQPLSTNGAECRPEAMRNRYLVL